MCLFSWIRWVSWSRGWQVSPSVHTVLVRTAQRLWRQMETSTVRQSRTSRVVMRLSTGWWVHQGICAQLSTTLAGSTVHGLHLSLSQLTWPCVISIIGIIFRVQGTHTPFWGDWRVLYHHFFILWIKNANHYPTAQIYFQNFRLLHFSKYYFLYLY